MKIYQFIIISLFSISVLSEESNTIDYRKLNTEVAESILKVVSTCGSKIWPNYNLKDLNIVFLDKASNDLVGLSLQTNSIIMLPTDKIPATAFDTLYGDLKIDDKIWMFINPLRFSSMGDNTYDKIKKNTFRTAIHESFHKTIQKSWTSPGNRGTFVPIKWEPRFYRAMILKNLAEYHKSRFSEHNFLKMAKYWFNLWSANYPEETRVTTDGYEGTAQLSEYLAEAYLHKTCEASSDDLFAFLQNRLSKESYLDGSYFSLDDEGYEVGLTAALILSQNNAIQDWQSLVEKGETPLVQLLKIVSPLEQEIDENFKKIFMDTQATEQKKTDEYLRPVYDVLNEADITYFNIPRSWNSGGSFSPSGFFIDTKLGLNLIPMNSSLSFHSPKTQENHLNSIAKAVYFNVSDNPCIKSHFNFAVRNSEVSSLNSENSKFQIKNSLITGVVTGQFKTSDLGKKWFCIEED